MSYLLYPIGLLFVFVSLLRRKCYSAGLFGRKRFPVPVISVGNITMGGTGKTPFTMHLAEKIKGTGMVPAIVMRGYGRRSQGAILVDEKSTPRQVGEEALIYHQNGICQVAVAEKREEAYPLFSVKPDIILLDDGYQHLRVERQKDIVLVDASAPETLRPYPFGKLREPLSSLESADLLVVTRGKLDDLPGRAARKVALKPHISASYEWIDPLCPGEIAITALRGRRIFLLLGLGNPGSFKKTASNKGLSFAGEAILPDHAFPEGETAERVIESVKRLGCDHVLTSEKDFLKWKDVPFLKELLLYPKVAVRIEDPEGQLVKLIEGTR